MGNKELGSKILQYRAEHNLSQKEFADKCNITVQTACNIENGIYNPSKITLKKILNLIGG